ncbi:MAG: S49 family peptidase [Acidobacteria bacterium]|nr:S49 family peptidase [Acidobacteriota bacterium]
MTVREGFLKGIGFVFGVAFAALFSLVVLSVAFLTLGAGIGAGIAGASGGAAVSGGAGGYTYVSGKAGSANKLLVLRIDGMILGTPPRDLSSALFVPQATYGYVIRRVLDEAAADASVKGVMLHMQTPGGTIFGARAIHDGVMAFRESKKPIIAWVEGLSASGGVMAMVGADKIYADHGSFIGSIGVIGPSWQFFNKPLATDGGLLGGGIVTQNGIEQVVISAGRGKDLGNPFRRATPEEIKVLQDGVNAEYASFVQHVASNRNIAEPTIRDEMGAQIFGNAQAEAFRLIDGTRDRTAAIDELATLAKLGKDFQLVRPHAEQQGWLAQMLQSRFTLAPPSASADPAAVVAREVCDAQARFPLAYYGNPFALCP